MEVKYKIVEIVNSGIGVKYEFNAINMKGFIYAELYSYHLNEYDTFEEALIDLKHWGDDNKEYSIITVIK